jgi:serine/threonine protein kinase
MPIDPKRVQAVFLVAVEQTDPAGRAAVLDRECQTDAELRHRVEDLLRANDQPGSFLDRPAASPPRQTMDEVPSKEPADSAGPADPRPAEDVGTIVAGRYKLLEQIGEGGMGAVWVAEQTQPVRRKVALKLIKAGMDSKTVLSRFEAERQALALMDHPNIAKVLDGGSTKAGRPFFVMEYVKGIPFVQYCDDARLSIAERLALFVPVCQAVQHAHQKGIIHRDLKPSNILICLYDGQPVPKVIDFGLAKAMHQPLTEHTLYTAHGVMMGTPLYMSPEQAEINNLDVDTRTDIYALGVILYELLTGTTPLEKHRFAEAAWQEMLRLIKDEEAPRPSARLSGSATLPSVAAQRHMEPAKLTRLVRGELDWIVMKCLEKDRSRRYETANGLARDVERYLADEVVEARPPSAGYRLRKIVRHHKGSLLAASLVMLALMGGIIGTTFGLLEAKNQQAEALAQKNQAETNAAEAQKQEKEAKDQLEISTTVTEFLQNDLLGQAGSKAQADRKFEPDPNLTIREALDRAAAAVGDKFKGRPELEASIRQTVGDAYREVGQYEKAIVQLQQSADIRKGKLGPDHSDTLTTLSSLALNYQMAGKMTEAIALFEQVRDAEVKKLGPDHPNLLTTLNNLAGAYQDAGKTTEAIALHEQVRGAQVKKLGPDHPDTLDRKSVV